MLRREIVFFVGLVSVYFFSSVVGVRLSSKRIESNIRIPISVRSPNTNNKPKSHHTMKCWSNVVACCSIVALPSSVFATGEPISPSAQRALELMNDGYQSHFSQPAAWLIFIAWSWWFNYKVFKWLSTW